MKGNAASTRSPLRLAARGRKESDVRKVGFTRHPQRRGSGGGEVKEIVSGMALATGIVTQCFPVRNRRLAPCRSLRQGLIWHHSAQGWWS